MKRASSRLTPEVIDNLLRTSNEKSPLSRFKFVKFLGQGSFGTVVLVTDESNPDAPKQSVLKFIDNVSRAGLAAKSEWRSQATFESTYIVQNLSTDYSTRWPILELEYCSGGQLFDFIGGRPESGFTTAFIAKCFRDMAIAVKVLHDADMVHRDIKPDNFLLSANPSEVPSGEVLIKLSDFGLAEIVSGPGAVYMQGGTKEYMAPELLEVHPTGGKPVDIWALGICLFVLVKGDLPGCRPDTVSADGGMWEPKHEEEMLEPVKADNPARALLVGMLRSNSQERLTIDQVLEDPWMTSEATEPLPNLRSHLRKWNLARKMQKGRSRSGSVGRIMMLPGLLMGKKVKAEDAFNLEEEDDSDESD
jgi:serine/threonine protein kinase